MRRKLFSIMLVLVLLIQLLPLNLVLAAGGENLQDKGWLTVYDTTGDDTHTPPLKSSIKILEADGTEISANGDGSYSDIPAGSKIDLQFAFSLSDGNGTDVYDYQEGDFFQITLPSGLDFTQATGTIQATDSSGGSYNLANWSISGDKLTVILTADGAADEHNAKWGLIKINGTFQPLNAGDDTATTVHFGSQTITINRQPLPTKSKLEKSGSYNAETNEITWTVTVTPPAGDPNLSYEGYTVVDTYSSNQTYVDDSFTVKNGTLPPETILNTDSVIQLDAATQTIYYTFPNATSGMQTITYKTTPNDFSGANGISTFQNTVNLNRNGETAADPEQGSVTLDWIDKTGGVTASTTDEPDIVLWTVTVKVPGEAGKSISGAKIVDQLQDLVLLEDDTHPVQIEYPAETYNVTKLDTKAGRYSYEGDTLTYFFPAGNQPQEGTNAILTFYTKVKDPNDALNNNAAIQFSNSATLRWEKSTDLKKSPSTSYTTTSGEGIGSGGLLFKSAANNNEQYRYGNTDTIKWTITVNRNLISMTDAEIKDIIPAGQELLIDDTHVFTVTEVGTAPPAYFQTKAATDKDSFTYTDQNQYSFLFSGTITKSYIITYYTKITNWSTLYKNGSIGFDNNVKLKRGGDNIEVTGTKKYNSQMISKSVATAYNYTTHLVQWQIVVNRNQLPLNNAIVTDTIPQDMRLFIDGTHPFEVTALNGGDPAGHNAVHDGTTFNVTLPATTSDQYTIKFWTKLTDESLKTRWDTQKSFTNQASLQSDEITTPITSTASINIKNPVVSKTGQQGDGTAGSNSDTIYWSVIVNPAQMTLHNAVISDTLHAALQLELDSVKLSTISIKPATGEYDTTKPAVPVELAPDAVTYEGNTLKVKLPDGPHAYLLEFATVILDDKVGTLTNTVDLTGQDTTPGGSAQSGSISVTEVYATGGSGSNTLTVHKKDMKGNSLEGAKFRLLNANKQPIKRGGNEMIQTTDDTGNASFTSLPSWVFYVEEIEPAPGYLIPTNPFAYGERLSGEQTVTMENALALTDVSFVKVGANDDTLTGGVFTLIGKDYKDDDVSKNASAVNGTVTFQNVPPNKAGVPYTITETSAPNGHKVNGTSLSATVAYNATKNGLVVTVNPSTKLVNTPTETNVSFTKTGQNGALLSGGSFTLTGKDYMNHDVTQTVSADGNGVVTFAGIQIGSYKITEVDAPNGYLMPSNPEILTVVVAYNADRSGLVATIKSTDAGTPVVTSYGNTKAVGNISFSKVDSSDHVSPLSGGRFQLTGVDCAGSAVSITTQSVGGTVTFQDVPVDDGNGYIIKEISPPSGYQLTTEQLTASVRYNNNKTAVVTSISQEKLSNDRKANITIFAKISVIKTDENGNKLSGAEFTMYNRTGDVIATAISDENGLANFGYIDKGFGYTIKETKAPDGFVSSGDSIKFSVENSSSQTFTVVNKKETEKPGSISIVKTDENGTVLAGAEFTLYNVDGQMVSTVVTKEDGSAVFDDIPAGSYTVKETLAPLGYVADANPTDVTVKSEESLSLTFMNKKQEESTQDKVTGKLQIAKVDKDLMPLEGAEFTLYGSDGIVFAKAVSGSDGMVVFDGLVSGNYTVRETVAPEGYKLFSEPLAVEISEAGDTLSYTLKNSELTDEDSDVAGWMDNDNDKDGGILPKTGGIALTVYIALAGLCLVLIGLVFAKPRPQPKRLSNRK